MAHHKPTPSAVAPPSRAAMQAWEAATCPFGCQWVDTPGMVFAHHGALCVSTSGTAHMRRAMCGRGRLSACAAVVFSALVTLLLHPSPQHCLSSVQHLSNGTRPRSKYDAVPYATVTEMLQRKHTKEAWRCTCSPIVQVQSSGPPSSTCTRRCTRHCHALMSLLPLPKSAGPASLIPHLLDQMDSRMRLPLLLLPWPQQHASWPLLPWPWQLPLPLFLTLPPWLLLHWPRQLQSLLQLPWPQQLPSFLLVLCPQQGWGIGGCGESPKLGLSWHQEDCSYTRAIQ
jgi:hypothetical protein